jgi:hypothetical protein
MSKLSVRNVYFTPVKKRTSILEVDQRTKALEDYTKEREDKVNHNATRTWINS